MRSKKLKNKVFKDIIFIKNTMTSHKQTEQELTELMPSLLDKAFKGEL